MIITTAKKLPTKKKATLLLGNTDETTMNHVTIHTALREINETTMNHMMTSTTAKKPDINKSQCTNGKHG